MICSEISVTIADNFARNEFRKYYRSVELAESFEKAYAIYDDDYNILGTVIFSVFANEANINIAHIFQRIEPFIFEGVCAATARNDWHFDAFLNCDDAV